MQINSTLDPDALAKVYAEDDRLKVADFLVEADAMALARAIDSVTGFGLAAHFGQGGALIPAQAWAAIPAEERKALQEQLHQSAQRGVGFAYEAIQPDNEQQLSVVLPGPVKDALEALNGADVLDFVQHVTGRNDLRRATVQLTRYQPGQYLTRHRDDPEGETRKIAFVLNLSPTWHPDWGGLLQFFEEDGETRDAWAPMFNRLHLFDVRHIHSVTLVAPFAGGPRLALTGWFRT